MVMVFTLLLIMLAADPRSPGYWHLMIPILAATVAVAGYGSIYLAQWWNQSRRAMRALHEAQSETPAPTPVRVDAADQRIAVDEREAGNEAVRDRAAAEG